MSRIEDLPDWPGRDEFFADHVKAAPTAPVPPFRRADQACEACGAEIGEGQFCGPCEAALVRLHDAALSVTLAPAVPVGVQPEPAEGLALKLRLLEQGFYQQMLDRDGVDRFEYLAAALSEEA